MRALVLNGGAEKGAYQAGVLKYILGDKKIHYDILCGVSIGAINAAFLAQFPYGKEKESAYELNSIWSSINQSDVYKRWYPFGKLHSLWNKSFYDSSPLHNLIRNNLNIDKIRNNGKKVSVGAVSLSSGKYTTFTQISDHFIDAVIASASFPGMFSPIKFMDQYWIDGGVKEASPIKQAIDMGATTIDIIMTSPKIRNKYFIENPSIIDILKRCMDLSTDKIMSNDIEKAEMYNKLASSGISNKKVIEINIIRPQFNLVKNLLNFDHEKIIKMIDIGYNDAKLMACF